MHGKYLSVITFPMFLSVFDANCYYSNKNLKHPTTFFFSIFSL